MSVFVEPVFTGYYKASPLTLVDVGASGGLDVHLRRAEKYMQLIGFEPDEKAFNDLVAKNNPNSRFFNVALFDKQTDIDYLITRKQTASSIFKPNMALREPFQLPDEFDIIKTVKMKTDSLDSIGQKNGITNIDFIKLDTQGSELFILKGAEHFLNDSIFGIEVEVEFSPIYIDQPLFWEVDAYLIQKGFALFNMGLVRWARRNSADKMTKGQLMTADAIYFKRADEVARIVNRYGTAVEKKAKVAKTISICLMYGHYDYALELLFLLPDLFTKEESDAAAKIIRSKMSRRWDFPDFRGRWALARLFYRLWSIIEPCNNRWNSFDNNLARF